MSRKVEPEPRHAAFRNDVIALLNKHAGHLDSVEMLALAAHLLGQIIAMQDQRKYTIVQLMETIAKNMEQGNGEVIGALRDTVMGHG